MYTIDRIDYSIECPETGKQLGAYGYVEDLKHVPDTTWYIVKIKGEIRIIGYSKIKEKQEKKKRHYILTLKSQPRAGTTYYHVDLYEAKAFKIETEPITKDIEFDSIKKNFDGLYVCENDDAVYYIIIG